MWEPDREPADTVVAPLPDYVAPAPAQAPTRGPTPLVAARPAPAPDAAWNWLTDPEDIWPAPPATLDDVGVSASFLQDLLVKIIHYAGPSTTEHLCSRIGLPFDLVEQLLDGLKAEHLIEIVSASRLNEMSFRYRLTTRGEQRAQDALARSRYASVAPVTLDQYSEVVRKQSLRSTPPSPGRILQALSQLVLSAETVDGLSRALHSGRSTLIFGSSGNGKTAILEQYARHADDTVIIPHALYVHGQIIRIYDAAVHQAVTEEPEPVVDDGYGLFKPQTRTARYDQRWLRVRRPVVVVGGELTQESLELSFDPVSHFYQAPPHLKAQDGMFVIDDFGRQRVRPEELLNRWILPMERGFDLLSLHTGESFTVPFEIALMFSTNLRPADLMDEAFMRRISYKVHIPSPTPAEFREITRRVATARRVTFTDEQLDYFVHAVFANAAREPKGVYPRDLIQVIMDSARFDGVDPELRPDLVDRAIRVYFIE
jgi:predicted ATPase with chaperone activity